MAQLALNTLKTPVVVPENNTLTITGNTGDTQLNLTSGSVNYVVTASTEPYARAIDDTLQADENTLNGIRGYVIQLGEKLYEGKLQLNDDPDVYDDFGRPSRKWQYDGKTFGTYTKVEQLREEYTTKVTGKMLYDELGSDIVRGINGTNTTTPWSLSVTIDGETTQTVLGDAYFSINSIVRTNTDKVGETGNGTLTQVYVDSINHVVDIAVINTYLAIAEQDYNAKDDDVDLKVYRIGDDNVKNHYAKTAKNLKKDEVIAAKGDKLDIVDVKEDDKFLVTVAAGEIQTMKAPEIVSETTLNSFKKNDWVKNNDVQYDYASTAQYDDEVLDEYDMTNMKDVTYNVILDKYGYLIGLELNEAVNQYLFLTGMDLGDSNLSAKNASANVIFADGTMSTVTVNVEKSECAGLGKVGSNTKDFTVTGTGDDINNIVAHVPGDHMSIVNTWCTYTVDGNGVYTVKQVGSRSDARSDSVGPVRTAKKVAQSYINVEKLAVPVVKTPGEVVINNKNTAMLGAGYGQAGGSPFYAATGTTTQTIKGDFNYVYGNNETVFINAKVKAINPKTTSGQTAAIVDKVDSVVTGISNVDLTVKDLKTNESSAITGANYLPDNEIYVLYNDKGYAIAVVTLAATDNGASSHFAYITGEVNEEDYIGENNWKWYVNAIVDGQKVRLTEVDDGMDYLKY